MSIKKDNEETEDNVPTENTAKADVVTTGSPEKTMKMTPPPLPKSSSSSKPSLQVATVKFAEQEEERMEPSSNFNSPKEDTKETAGADAETVNSGSSPSPRVAHKYVKQRAIVKAVITKPHSCI